MAEVSAAKPRATWIGSLAIGEASVAIRAFSATTSGRVRLTSIHLGCNHQLEQQTHCPVHGQVGRDEIQRAYRCTKEQFVTLTGDELAALAPATDKVISVEYFIDSWLLDQVYRDAAYYVAPDGPLADEPFRVVRDAMRLQKRAAIGRVGMSGRERIVCLEAHGLGMLMHTLRTDAEVRGPEAYFAEISDRRPSPSQVRAARDLVASMSDAPRPLEDRREAALWEMLGKKVADGDVLVVHEKGTTQGADFGDALKASASPKRRKRKG